MIGLRQAMRDIVFEVSLSIASLEFIKGLINYLNTN